MICRSYRIGMIAHNNYLPLRKTSAVKADQPKMAENKSEEGQPFGLGSLHPLDLQIKRSAASNVHPALILRTWIVLVVALNVPFTVTVFPLNCFAVA